jgi:hypothetical protein
VRLLAIAAVIVPLVWAGSFENETVPVSAGAPFAGVIVAVNASELAATPLGSPSVTGTRAVPAGEAWVGEGYNNGICAIVVGSPAKLPESPPPETAAKFVTLGGTLFATFTVTVMLG